jgi:hypothetical protein
MTIFDCDSNASGSGIVFRKGRSGPEQNLVDWFLERNAVKPRRGECLTVFREPRLPSGFPDLVAVIWKKSVAWEWRNERRNITAHDLRLMQFLVTSGPSQLPELRFFFGAGIIRSLDRLERSHMVVLSKQQWQARALSQTFAIRRIVAIEAKVAEWRAALDQAFINTWFTPESYILIPAVPKGAGLLETAVRHGIGVLSKEKLGLVEHRVTQPLSYASWLFNEWTWRLATS